MRLWIKLKKRNPWRTYFIYADTDDERCGVLLMERRIGLRYHRIYKNDNEPYKLILVSIPTRQIDEFEDGIRDNAKQMLLLGYTDYDEWCDRLFKRMKEVFDYEGKEFITGDN